MSRKYAKRFYEAVTTGPVTLDGIERFAIYLDRRVLKTPKGKVLSLPRRAAAELLADEWRMQTDEILPQTMPITRLINVAFDQAPLTRGDLIDEAARYAGTDLLCYRVAVPLSLTERQHHHWDPVLEWATKKGIGLVTTTSIAAVEQPKSALNVLRQYAENLDDIDLTLFVHLVSVLGSAILGLAVMEGFIDASAAFDLSRLDENYQSEIWGIDDTAQERTETIRAEILALASILELEV